MFLSDIYLADFLSVINLETVGPDLFSGFFKRYLFGNHRPGFSLFDCVFQKNKTIVMAMQTYKELKMFWFVSPDFTAYCTFASMATLSCLPVLAWQAHMKVISRHVSCTNMFLFHLEPNHKPILNPIVHET
jgi:hypothetical protein